MPDVIVIRVVQLNILIFQSFIVQMTLNLNRLMLLRLRLGHESIKTDEISIIFSIIFALGTTSHCNLRGFLYNIKQVYLFLHRINRLRIFVLENFGCSRSTFYIKVQQTDIVFLCSFCLFLGLHCFNWFYGLLLLPFLFRRKEFSLFVKCERVLGITILDEFSFDVLFKYIAADFMWRRACMWLSK